MATVGSFASRPHAEMAVAMLEGYGIRARVLGDDAGGVAPHYNMGSGGGYALEVADEDHDTAVELLRGDDGSPVGDGDTRSHRVARIAMWVVLAAILAPVVWNLVGMLSG